MSTKNFVSNGDAETLFTGIGNKLSTLKSGLINVQGDVKLNTQDLTTPSRTKNILPITIDVIKSGNTTGTWTDNAYTINGITYTFNTNADGQITDITASGTASANADLKLLSSFTLTKQCILTGCPANGSSNRWYIGIQSYGSDNGNGLTVDANTYGQLYIRVASGITITTPMQFYPMLRYATITDPTFAPYIPSVESRIEAVESGLDDVQSGLTKKSTVISGTNVIGTAYNISGIICLAIYDGGQFSCNANSVIFTLPVGFRPSADVQVVNTASGHERILINSSGQVIAKDAFDNSYARFTITFM